MPSCAHTARDPSTLVQYTPPPPHAHTLSALLRTLRPRSVNPSSVPPPTHTPSHLECPLAHTQATICRSLADDGKVVHSQLLVAADVPAGSYNMKGSYYLLSTLLSLYILCTGSSGAAAGSAALRRRGRADSLNNRIAALVRRRGRIKPLQPHCSPKETRAGSLSDHSTRPEPYSDISGPSLALSSGGVISLPGA